MEFSESCLDDCRIRCDVAIIGAGVAGLYAAYCCGINGLECAITETLDTAGGQCTALYAEKVLYGVPGYGGVTAGKFIENVANECLPSAKYKFFGCNVEEITKANDSAFVIRFQRRHTRTTHEITARYLVIATGIGEMVPGIPPGIAGLERLDANSDFVQYYCLREDFYRGKNVIIVGGGDSAADCAIMAANVANSVVLMHKKPKLRCEAAKLSRIKELQKSGRLTVALEHKVLEVVENSGKRTVIANDVVFEVDHIVFCCGFVVSNRMLSMFDGLGLETESNLIKIDINTMLTSVRNCYAVGDVITYTDKKKNVISCLFEADRVVRMIKSGY
jgi:thioredoxin reductase (NADPH)